MSDDDAGEIEPPFHEADFEVEQQGPARHLGPDPPEVPKPHDPTESLPDESEVSGELASAFWKLVLLANVALLGLTAGPMALYFDGNRRLGFGLLAVGLLATVVGAQRYREAKAAQEAAAE